MSDWNQTDHPRGPGGKFAAVPGGGGHIIDHPSIDQISVGDHVFQTKKNRWVEVVGKDGNTLQVKLPNGAVVPTAAADKVKKGVAPDRPKKHEPAHLASMRKNVAAFEDSGGTVQSSADPVAADRDLNRQIDAMMDKNPDFQDDDGVLFTLAAIEHAKEQGRTSSGVDVQGPVFLIAATAPGIGVVGAMSVERRKDELWIEYAGATGGTKGAGSAMAKELARLSAGLGLPVNGHPADKGAETFWKKVGWSGSGGSMGWTVPQAQEVASSDA